MLIGWLRNSQNQNFRVPLTVKYNLRAVVPESQLGVAFVDIEMLTAEDSPLAVVWYTTGQEPFKEKGARIDLEKQAFLDDFGTVSREQLRATARLIVKFVHSITRPQIAQSV